MTFDLGDTVPLSVDVLDADGAPTAAASVTLTLDLPDGSALTPLVSNPSTGRYEVDFVPAVPGRFGVRWTSTDPATAYSDVFDVRPAAPRYMISLAQAKRHLNITSTLHDEELRGHIEAATSAIELYLGETVVRRTVVEQHTLDRPTSAIALDQYPVVSLTSVAALNGSVSWDVGSFDLDRSTGMLRAAGAGGLSGTVVVTYVAGRSEVPANYARAAEIVVEHLYGPQRSAGAGPPSAPGGEEALAPDDYGTVIPPMAINLLGASAPPVG